MPLNKVSIHDRINILHIKGKNSTCAPVQVYQEKI